jgi:SAM-dependent methyltransferase
VKILLKVVLSRLPFGYWTLHRLGAFRHGAMHEPRYAVEIVTRHINRLEAYRPFKGATCLELGPGDSLASILIAHALGASQTILVDSGNFVSTDMAVYRAIASELNGLGYSLPDIQSVKSTDELLSMFDAQYLTEGLASLKALATGSVDIIWSQAVLEHVRVGEVGETFAEFERILRPRGAMSHRIDFKDHLGGSLNNMRFSSRLWESEFMASSGFYTNRLKYSQMIALLEGAGFSVEPVKVDRWTTMPLSRRKLAPEYRELKEDDLLIKGCDLIAIAGKDSQEGAAS